MKFFMVLVATVLKMCIPSEGFIIVNCIVTSRQVAGSIPEEVIGFFN
jgi:hypothetical protein